MKKILITIICASVIGFLSAWAYFLNTNSYKTGLTWVEQSQAIQADVGVIRHVYPDISSFRILSSGTTREARYALFVSGSRGRVRVTLLLREEKQGWAVVEARTARLILNE